MKAFEGVGKAVGCFSLPVEGVEKSHWEISPKPLETLEKAVWFFFPLPVESAEKSRWENSSYPLKDS